MLLLLLLCADRSCPEIERENETHLSLSSSLETQSSSSFYFIFLFRLSEKEEEKQNSSWTFQTFPLVLSNVLSFVGSMYVSLFFFGRSFSSVAHHLSNDLAGRILEKTLVLLPWLQSQLKKLATEK